MSDNRKKHLEAWVIDIVVISFIAGVGVYTVGRPGRTQEAPPERSTSGNAGITQLRKLDITCPPPTVKAKGGNCVLTTDVTLTEPLDIATLTHLNCKGFKILPRSGGSFGTDPNGRSTVTNSTPRAAFVLHEAYGTKIKNCIIGEEGNRFDFGILVLDSKIAPELEERGNEIINNSIITVRTAVTILGSDHNVIGNNILRISAAAPAIHILRDSDSNKVLNNHIVLDGHGAAQVPNSFVSPPGEELSEETVPGHFVDNRPSQVTHILIAGRTPDNELINFRLGDQLLQFPVTRNSETGNANEQPDHNIIDGNTLDRKTTTWGFTANIFESGGSSNIVRNNIVNEGWMGIAITGEVGDVATYPGTCTLDGSRYCRFASDCATLEPNPPGGTCAGVLTKQSIDESAENVIVRNNILTGPYTSPFAPQGLFIANTRNIRVVGNTVRFNGEPNGPNDPGAAIFGRGNENAVFSRNVITGNSIAMRLDSQSLARSFGAKVSLNDFDGNMNNTVDDGRTTDRFSSSPSRFPFLAELSVNGRGNYWGRTCADSQGFYDANELHTCTHDSSVSCTTDSDCSALSFGSTCIKTTDSPSPLVTDSHPYGQPVAGTPRALLPATCK